MSKVWFASAEPAKPYWVPGPVRALTSASVTVNLATVTGIGVAAGASAVVVCPVVAVRPLVALRPVVTEMGAAGCTTAAGGGACVGAATGASVGAAAAPTGVEVKVGTNARASAAVGWAVGSGPKEPIPSRPQLLKRRTSSPSKRGNRGKRLCNNAFTIFSITLYTWLWYNVTFLLM